MLGAVPAWNRAGAKPVGVFDLMVGPDAPTKYVLLPFNSLDAMAVAHEKFEADADMLKSEFANVPPTDPAYVRRVSSLLRALAGMRKLEVPGQTAEKKPRIFELRTYEAHSRKANKKKVEMFNLGEMVTATQSVSDDVFELLGQELGFTVQIVSPEDSIIKWVGGLYYLHGHAAYEPFKIQGTATTPPPLDYVNFLSDELTNSYAGFGQTTAPIPALPACSAEAGPYPDARGRASWFPMIYRRTLPGTARRPDRGPTLQL